MELRKEIETHSAAETFALGEDNRKRSKAGQVYALLGDLGVGKTVLIQGVAKGLGIDGPGKFAKPLPSMQVYENGRLPFYHFDVYRIGDVEEMDEIGYEEYFYGEGVSFVEWANLVEEIMPKGKRYGLRLRRTRRKGLIIAGLALFSPEYRRGCR